MSGRRRALLVGCNYPGSKYQLQGCIRDVKMIKQTLQFQYQYEDILLLVVRFHPHPSCKTRREHLSRMARKALVGLTQDGQVWQRAP